MKYKVPNFTDADVMEIQPGLFDGKPLVNLVVSSSSLRMQHDITVQQARQMAEDLLAAAKEAEQMVIDAMLGIMQKPIVMDEQS
jgi:hypothetical protein